MKQSNYQLKGKSEKGKILLNVNKCSLIKKNITYSGKVDDKYYYSKINYIYYEKSTMYYSYNKIIYIGYI